MYIIALYADKFGVDKKKERKKESVTKGSVSESHQLCVSQSEDPRASAGSSCLLAEEKRWGVLLGVDGDSCLTLLPLPLSRCCSSSHDSASPIPTSYLLTTAPRGCGWKHQVRSQRISGVYIYAYPLCFRIQEKMFRYVVICVIQ